MQGRTPTASPMNSHGWFAAEWVIAGAREREIAEREKREPTSCAHAASACDTRADGPHYDASSSL